MTMMMVMIARTISANPSSCSSRANIISPLLTLAATTTTTTSHGRRHVTTTSTRTLGRPSLQQHYPYASRRTTSLQSHRCAFVSNSHHDNNPLLFGGKWQRRSIEATTTTTAVRSSSGQMASFSTQKSSSLSSSLSQQENNDNADTDDNDDSFFASSQQYDSFAKIGIQSPILLQRLNHRLKLTRPSRVQAATFPILSSQTSNGENDVIVGAETGSGKTLAYLLPLIDDILCRKQQHQQKEGLGYDFARALILVPNKELVQQVIRMAMDLCGGSSSLVTTTSKAPSSPIFRGGTSPTSTSHDDNDEVDPKTIVRIAVLPGGLSAPQDFAPFRQSSGDNEDALQPAVDLLISTPAAIGPWGLSPKNIEFFADIRTVVMDEADMLLDGGYLPQLEQVLLGFKRADRLEAVASGQIPKTQMVFCAATLPNSGLRSVEAYLERKFPRIHKICLEGMHNAKHSGLRQQPTQWMLVDEKKERMQRLVQMLQQPPPSTNDNNNNNNSGLQGDKVMIFLNTVQDVDTACLALNRVGILCVPYHAKLSLIEKSENLDRFRRFQPIQRQESNQDKKVDGRQEQPQQQDEDAVPVLVCTDLASRGLDVPGVTAVVQLQFAGNVVAHLHRMGRCGRAGAKGRGIVFYSEAERDLVQVVQEAEERQDQKMVLVGNVEEIEIADDDDNANDSVTTIATTAKVAEKRDAVVPAGSVETAFSRRRGFSKKRKKLRREYANDDDDGDYE